MSSQLKIKIPSYIQSYMDTQQQASLHPMELQQHGHKKASSFPTTPTKQSKPTFQHQWGQTDQQQGSQTPPTPPPPTFQQKRGQMKTTPYTPFSMSIDIPQQQIKKGQMMSSQTPPTPTKQNFLQNRGQMKTTLYTPYTPPFSMRIHIPQQQIKKKQMMSFPTTPTTPTTPPTPFYPYPKKNLSFGQDQMGSQDMKSPPNPRKKISFDASLPQDQTKKTKTRLKRHSMSADDKSNFYSKSNIKKMRGQSRTAVPTMKQFFKSHLATRYTKSVVRQIMSVLNAKVEQKVKTKRDEVANLNLQQARKYFLEEIIMEEMQNMALGKPLTLLPKVSQIYPNHVTIKNLRNENTFIPIEEGVTNGMIRLIYASLIGVDDPSKIIFLKDGNLIEDADYTESCIINAIVTL
jgi:hypothetical protein